MLNLSLFIGLRLEGSMPPSLLVSEFLRKVLISLCSDIAPASSSLDLLR